MMYVGKNAMGEPIIEYTIFNGNLELKVLNLGATITSLKISNGRNVVLGFDNKEDYVQNNGNLGALIVPNGNRIANAEIEIDHKKYYLQKNNYDNNLHSHNLNAGHKRNWQVEEKENQLILTCSIDESEDLFPGKRDYKVIYTLINNDLCIDYYCISDTKTVFNPTSHAYFNLNGHDSGTVLNHKLQLNCGYFTPSNEQLIPTGEILSVKGTPMDFTIEKQLGKDIQENYAPLIYGKGYDHNFVFNNYDGTLKELGYLMNEDTKMTILSTQPGIQVYTGNYLGTQITKGGHVYQKYDGVALETQFFPDAVHHYYFPSSIIEANRLYHYQTVYRFEVKSCTK